MPRRYPVELGHEVLDLIEAGEPEADVADLGVSDQTSCDWRNQDRIDRLHSWRPARTIPNTIVWSNDVVRRKSRPMSTPTSEPTSG